MGEKLTLVCSEVLVTLMQPRKSVLLSRVVIKKITSGTNSGLIVSGRLFEMSSQLLGESLGGACAEAAFHPPVHSPCDLRSYFSK